MGKGRRPQPTALKLVKGNPGKRALNRNEPITQGKIQDCPGHLTAEGKRAWARLSALFVDLGVLSELDEMALERVCDIYAEILSCRRSIKKHGRTYKALNATGQTLIKTNPAVGQLADADRRFRGYLIEFGLTPASRSKVNFADPENNQDPLDEFFN